MPVVPAVELQQASFGYSGKAIISEANLTVTPGESLLLLGSNGSGKSTLVKGILGICPLRTGTVTIGGQPHTTRAAKQLIGYVPQRQTAASPIPATVREVVTSGALARRGWLGRLHRSDRNAIDQAITAMDLQPYARRPVAQLSGGQQRRVLIARALASRPKLLILDEPLAGVDRANQIRLAESLKSLQTDNLTVMVVSHELEHLMHLTQRVLYLDHGDIAYDGTIDDLHSATTLLTSPAAMTQSAKP